MFWPPDNVQVLRGVLQTPVGLSGKIEELRKGDPGPQGPPGPGVPSEGTTGQVLAKKSNTDYDTEWTTLPITSGTGNRSIVSVNPSNPNVASATVSIALGQDNTASGTGAISMGTKVSGQSGNTSSGNGSVAIGSSLTASGNYAVALGTLNTSSGQAALAIGRESTANAHFSSAIGLRNIASGAGSFVIGARNEEDTNALDATRGITGARKYILIVGNGTADDARSNAMTVDWDGNEVLAGKLTLGAAPTANMDAATKQYVDGSISGLTAADVGAQPQIVVGSVTLTAANWTGSGPYTQTVTVTGATVTSSSKVDIQPDATAISQLITDSVKALYIVNNAGALTATAIGAAPTANLTVQVTVTEVS